MSQLGSFCFGLSILAVISATSCSRTSPSREIISKANKNQDEIARLENFLEKNPDHFNWKVHNELRHLYGGSNKRKAMEHANIILEHSIMDGYMMNILSGWQLDKGPQKAILNLNIKAKEYSDLEFIRAATLIETGHIHTKLGNIDKAESNYLKVKDGQSPELASYAVVAEAGLEQLIRPEQNNPDTDESPVPDQLDMQPAQQ
jgi:tetratricopeptide (TPR) repeat protein